MLCHYYCEVVSFEPQVGYSKAVYTGFTDPEFLSALNKHSRVKPTCTINGWIYHMTIGKKMRQKHKRAMITKHKNKLINPLGNVMSYVPTYFCYFKPASLWFLWLFRVTLLATITLKHFEKSHVRCNIANRKTVSVALNSPFFPFKEYP